MGRAKYMRRLKATKKHGRRAQKPDATKEEKLLAALARRAAAVKRTAEISVEDRGAKGLAAISDALLIALAKHEARNPQGAVVLRFRIEVYRPSKGRYVPLKGSVSVRCRSVEGAQEALASYREWLATLGRGPTANSSGAP
jgi:hypothetical protein